MTTTTLPLCSETTTSDYHNFECREPDSAVLIPPLNVTRDNSDSDLGGTLPTTGFGALIYILALAALILGAGLLLKAGGTWWRKRRTRKDLLILEPYGRKGHGTYTTHGSE